MILKNTITLEVAEFENLQEGWIQANSSEIDQYNFEVLKKNYIANRKDYLKTTFIHHERDLDGHTTISPTILSNRTNAHSQIDSIEATTNQTELDALGLSETFPS